MALRQIALGTISMASTSVLRIMAQLFVLPILARYLSPEDYGIVALAMPFVFFCMTFADAGISQSLIRSRHYNHFEWSSCFWLMGVLGIVLTFVLIALGYLISIFMQEPRLFPIITALSGVIFLQSLTTVPAASLQQSNRFTVLATADIIAMFISIALTLWAAMSGLGAWALVIQQVSLYGSKLVTISIAAGFLPVFQFQKNMVMPHLYFGRDMLGNGIVGSVKAVGTNAIIGKLLGSAALGHYSMGQSFSEISRRVTAGPVDTVLYPRFAAITDDFAKLRPLFLFASQLLGFILIPLLGMIALAHQPVFNLLLTEKWAIAGDIYAILFPGALVTSLTVLRHSVLKVLGQTGIILRTSIELTILQMIVLSITSWYGLYWAMAGISLVQCLYTPRPMGITLRMINLPFKTYLAVYATPLIALLIYGALYLGITEFYTLPEWAEFLTAFGMGILCLISIALYKYKAIVRDIKLIEELFTTP